MRLTERERERETEGQRGELGVYCIFKYTQLFQFELKKKREKN